MKPITAILFVLFAAVLAVFAQTNTVPADPLPELPGDVGSYWKYAVAAVTPMIVTFIHFAVPKLPKVILPSITPFIGLALGYVLNQLGAANLGWVDMAEAGALAVFIREITNQAITKRLETPDVPTAPLRR